MKAISAKKKTQVALKIIDIMNATMDDNLEAHLHVLDLAASLTVPDARVVRTENHKCLIHY